MAVPCTLRRIDALRKYAPVLAGVLIISGCGAKSSQSTTTARTTTRIAIDRPASVNAAFERGYSECSTTSLQKLAAKYSTQKTPQAVAAAAGRSWARIFRGGPDTAKAGANGCLQAIRTRGKG